MGAPKRTFACLVAGPTQAFEAQEVVHPTALVLPLPQAEDPEETQTWTTIRPAVPGVASPRVKWIAYISPSVTHLVKNRARKL